MEEPPAASPPIGLGTGLTELYRHMSPSRRRQFFAVLALMLVGAFAELATIGSVIPFLAVLSQQATHAQLPWPGRIFASLGQQLHSGSILAPAMLFSGFAIFAALIRLELAWLIQDFVFRLGHELAVDIQRRILAQPYSFHVGRSSSTLLVTTEVVELLVFNLLLPLMQTVIAGFIATFLVIGLLFLDPVATLIAAAAFAGVYALVTLATGKRLAENSLIVGSAYQERFKIVQESLGGIRDVIIDNSQAMHLGIFERINAQLANARATTTFISQAPRFVVEGTGMVVLAGIAVLMSGRPGGIALALPFLGALALGAQRLLPLVQVVYTGWSLSAGHRSIAGQVVELLRLPAPRPGPRPAVPALQLRKRISIDRVSFRYPTRPDATAIADVTLDIPAGCAVAIIGKTGSGKTTLADLLMGLLEPTAGQIRIDGVELTRATARQWQENVAHVSQSIFLADTSIARNIALSLPDLPPDHGRIVEAATKAQLHDFIASLPAGYDTLIGERGIRLSGGQRQRLGIARAIYKGTNVLVFDEATSALDEATEAAVIAALDELRGNKCTIIIVAHRRSTVRHCDLVLRLDQGSVAEFGLADDVLGASAALS